MHLRDRIASLDATRWQRRNGFDRDRMCSVAGDFEIPERQATDAEHEICIHILSGRQGGPWPDAAELDWAKRVLASEDGAVSIDGQMVDAPVRARAESIMSAAERHQL